MDRALAARDCAQARRRPPTSGACARSKSSHEPREDVALRRSRAAQRRAASRSPRCRTLTLAPGDRLLVNGAVGRRASPRCSARSPGIWPFGEGRDPDSGRRARADAVVAAVFSARHAAAGARRAGAGGRGRRRRYTRGDAHRRPRHLIDRLDEEAEWTTALSAGEQHRVGFARALIHRPGVLLLDDADAMLRRSAGRTRLLRSADGAAARSDHRLREPLARRSRTCTAAPSRSGRASGRRSAAPQRVLAIATPV